MAELSSSPSLWDFALRLYARPGVAEACLRLQDEYKANVCLLIAMRWLDERGQTLSNEGFTHLKSHIAGWTTVVVEPLRHLRRLLKQPFETMLCSETQEQLRTTIKQAELLAEKKLLEEVEIWVSKNSLSKSMGTNKNLELYAKELSAPQELIALVCKS